LPNVPLAYRIEHLFVFVKRRWGMARRGRKCVVADCQKVAAVGSVVCQEHRDTALGEQTDREIMKMTQRLDAMAKYEDGEEKREAVRLFRRQVARGDYAALFSSEMVNTLTQQGKGYDLLPEIGMMRMAMLRLMLEEENPSRMAHGLAKLSGALGKSMERQEAWDKAERQRRQVRAYREANKFPAPPGFDGEVIETRGGMVATEPEAGAERDAIVETADAMIDQLEKAVGGAEREESGEVSSSDWPRPGYPDYYVDVDDWEPGQGSQS
jgi:hypothetical protein